MRLRIKKYRMPNYDAVDRQHILQSTGSYMQPSFKFLQITTKNQNYVNVIIAKMTSSIS